MSNARPPRSRGFWIWGCVFIFLIHAFAIFYFGEREKSEPPFQRPRPFLYLAGDSAVEELLTDVVALRDPMVFVRPHPEGFSGGAWMQFRTDPPKLTNWTAAPEWLPLPVANLGSTLAEYVATNRISDEPLLAALRAPRPVELRVPSEPLMTNTVARIEGPLETRVLAASPALPAVTHGDVLKNSGVSVTVNGEGLVESASLVAPSGSAAADVLAVELARAFAFKPLANRNARERESAPPTIGRIVFKWQVVPPTNATAATASATLTP